MLAPQHIPIPSGPFVTAALLCRNVIVHADGAGYTIEDLVESIALAKPGPQRLPLTLVVRLSSLQPGRRVLGIAYEGPNGLKSKPITFELDIPEGQETFHFDQLIGFDVEESGTYRIHVMMDDKYLSQSVLEIVVPD